MINPLPPLTNSLAPSQTITLARERINTLIREFLMNGTEEFTKLLEDDDDAGTKNIISIETGKLNDLFIKLLDLLTNTTDEITSKKDYEKSYIISGILATLNELEEIKTRPRDYQKKPDYIIQLMFDTILWLANEIGRGTLSHASAISLKSEMGLQPSSVLYSLGSDDTKAKKDKGRDRQVEAVIGAMQCLLHYFPCVDYSEYENAGAFHNFWWMGTGPGDLNKDELAFFVMSFYAMEKYQKDSNNHLIPVKPTALQQMVKLHKNPDVAKYIPISILIPSLGAGGCIRPHYIQWLEQRKWADPDSGFTQVREHDRSINLSFKIRNTPVEYNVGTLQWWKRGVIGTRMLKDVIEWKG